MRRHILTLTLTHVYRQPVQCAVYICHYESMRCTVVYSGVCAPHHHRYRAEGRLNQASLREVTAETGTVISPLSSLSMSERRDERGRARLNIPVE